ncbi:MAG: VCBS repeat-containing protein [Planctomycetes bacterium]|nr:VCBS repeat-containing protein [Planctomycetota bacterium]
MSIIAFIGCLAGPMCCASPGTSFAFEGATLFRFPDSPGRPRAVAIGDLNRDGIPDAVASFGTGEASVRAYLAEAPLVWSETCALATLGTEPILLADVTGDGCLDALAFQFISHSESVLAILAGDGAGGLTPMGSVPIGGWGTHFQTVVRDIDADGHVDILLAKGQARILYGPDFSGSVVLPAGDSVSGSAFLDVDRDGRDDLIVARVESTPLQLFLARADGGFDHETFDVGARGPLYVSDIDGAGDPEIVARHFGDIVALSPEKVGGKWSAQETPLRVGSSATDFVLADLDRDGTEDLVTSRSSDSWLDIVFGERRDGALSFEGESIPVGRPELSSHPTPFIRAVGDIDSDGFDDILLDSGYVRVTGRGRLAAAARISEGPLASAVAADIVGDGYADLVTLSPDSSHGVEVRRGGADGLGAPVEPVFVPPFSVDVLAVGRLTPREPISLFMARGDRMGRCEISASGEIQGFAELQVPGFRPSRLSVVRWNGAETAELLALRVPEGAPPIIGLYGVSAAGLERASWEAYVSMDTRDVIATDLEGDGFTDLIYLSRLGARVARGGSEGPRIYSDSVRFPWTQISSFRAVDLNGDGVSEILASSRAPEVRVVRRSADGVLISEVLGATQVNVILPEDLDGDGAPDIVAGTDAGFQIYYNDGEGTLLPPFEIPLARGVPWRSAAVADLDGDGHLDLAARQSEGVSVVYGKEGGRFESFIQVPTPGSGTLAVRIRDLSGDGLPDLVMRREWASPLLVAVARGGGDFDPAISLELGLEGKVEIFQALDLDGDGKMDLVATQGGPKGLYFCRGRGGLAFDAGKLLPGPDVRHYDLRCGDVNGDGIDDFVTYDTLEPTSGIYIYLAEAGSAPSAPRILESGMRVRGIALVDLNGDGALDVVAAGEDAGGADIWRAFPGRGDGTFGGGVALPPLHVGPDTLARLEDLIADLNGDSIPDTLRLPESRLDNRLVILLGNGDFTFQEIVWKDLGSEWWAMAFADLDGDGRQDLVGLGQGQERTFVARGRGAEAFDDPQFFALKSLRAVADLDGDGLKDLLFERSGYVLVVPASRKTLLAAPRSFLFPEIELLAAGDFAGDGRMRLISWRQFPGEAPILELDAKGDLVEVVRVPLKGPDDPSESLPLTAHDVDGDGKDDIAFLTGKTVHWLRSRGDLSFDPPAPLLEDAEGTNVSFCDLDGDGFEDLLTSHATVARGHGGAVFERLGTYRADDRSGAVTVGDFTGDGVLDVAQTINEGALIVIAEGDGNLGFGASEFLPSGGDGCGGLAVGDFDGDGMHEVATGGWEKSAGRVWRLPAPGEPWPFVELEEPFEDPRATNQLAATDADGDGFDDLFALKTEGAIVTYRGGPEGLRLEGPIVQGPEYSSVFLAANFVGDSGTDLVFREDEALFLMQGLSAERAFLRGDPNGDGRVDIADIVWLLSQLFRGGRASTCEDAADANDDGRVNLSDVLFIAHYVFLEGPRPAEPFPACGLDGTTDPIGCSSYRSCTAASR